MPTQTVMGDVDWLRVIQTNNTDGEVLLRNLRSQRPGPDVYLTPKEAIDLATLLLEAAR